MTDLQCPATLIVSRHADATYATLGIVSNDGGWLTDLGRKQAAALAEQLVDRRVAAIWCSDMHRSVQTAAIVSEGLGGIPVQVRPGLREVSVGASAGLPLEVFDSFYLPWLDGDLHAGPPGGETGLDVLQRMSAELNAAADLFRGETVLVISHGAAIGLALPYLARNVPADYARGRDLANCGTCEVSVDGDGWTLHTWGSEPV